MFYTLRIIIRFVINALRLIFIIKFIQNSYQIIHTLNLYKFINSY